MAGPSGGASGTGKISKKPHCAGGRGTSAAVSGGVTVTLEAEWITEHARQVARMLPGGELPTAAVISSSVGATNTY